MSPRPGRLRHSADSDASVSPLVILLEEVLPSYGEDTRHIVQRILQVAHDRNEEVAIQDGFELYRELSEIRRIHTDALPR